MSSICYERNRNKLFLIYIAIILVLLFQDILQQYMTPFFWADEIIGVCSLPLSILLLKVKPGILSKEEKIIVVAFISFILIGIFSSIVYRFQDIKVSFSDMVLISKFIGAYFFSRSFFNEIKVEDCAKYIKAIFRGITAIVFLTTVADHIFEIFPAIEKAFILREEKLLFYHPTYLAVFCVIILAYLTLVSQNKLIDYVFIIQIMLVCASTLTTKALGLLFVYAGINLLIKKANKIKVKYLVLGAIIMVMLFLPEVQYYYAVNEQSPRYQLTINSFRIANSFFPLGAGFATYGSFYSGVSYSPLYEEFHLDSIWGLNRSNTQFISDTFWPMILGQFGYFGLIFFLIVLINFGFLIKRLMSVNTNYAFFALVPFMYLFISSTSESSFANGYSVSFFLMIGMAVSQIKQQKTNEEYDYSKQEDSYLVAAN